MTNKILGKKWYLLMVEDRLTKPVQVTVTPERLLSRKEVLSIVESFGD